MIIPINLPSPSSTTATQLPLNLAKLCNSEVVLIELQGTLVVEGDSFGQHVGKLKLEGDNAKPTLLIGHHLLEGKIVTLQKPLAVLHRAGSRSRQDDAEEMDVEESKQTSYEMIGLVRRKIVFATRPMPVVSPAAVKQAIEKDDTEGKRKKLKVG
ncbi:hypothetical protein NEOLEDRAFT_1059330 [Neolentinus lepideus HHB14362 ss-1]|uniref:Ctf8-domain-containing protein n=1 Tax=Neolentinus lepideus HHB14362 ss-1 TaxID=1314782 RepID=A0A165UFI4_9AGAM|nr:hypothetical protein NEOLEDRAFT_1059330 [Neolentinus lepideus HHB14362 ss-1]